MFGVLIWRFAPELTRPSHIDPAFQLPSGFDLASLRLPLDSISPWATRTAPLPYNAQHFAENNHLGDDLNGIGGENSDLGDPIYAVAGGRVLLARDGGSAWGNVIIVLHAFLGNAVRRYVQSIAIRFWSQLAMTCIAASKSQPLAPEMAAISPICILKCASALRHSSGRVIGRKPTAGSTRASSSLRTAARRKMILVAENRVVRSKAGMVLP